MMNKELDAFYNNNSDDPAILTLVKNEITKISYKRLNQKVDLLCQYLQKKQLDDKIKNKIVAVLLPQSVEYVIAMLAIFKAELIYMPLYDNALETEEKNRKNITERLDKAGANFTLIAKNYLAALGQSTQQIKENKPSDVRNEYAMIMSSSGTSGKPKIIGVPKDALMQRIKDHQTRMQINYENPDIMLGLLNYAWDASVMETLSALTAGIPLFIVPEEIRKSIGLLPDLFQNAQQAGFAITTGIFIPSILNDFSPQQFPGLKKFLATGEAFANLEKVTTWIKADIQVFNGWGPTEITFGGSLIEIQLQNNQLNDIPIFQLDNGGLFTGIDVLLLKHNDNTRLWQLSEDKNGAEIFIYGNGIGAYINDEDRNRSSFIEEKHYSAFFSDETIAYLKDRGNPKLFKTCDIVTITDNKVIFSYRSDRMIKRGGKQINLEDIEKSLRNDFPEAIVLYHNRLIKAFVPYEIMNAQTLYTGYKEIQIFYQLNPKTKGSSQNAKANRKIEELIKGSIKIQTAPSRELTEVENKIAVIWQTFLEPDLTIAPEDSFTETFGAESLMLMQMINRVWIDLFPNKEQSSVVTEISKFIWKNNRLQDIALLVEHCRLKYVKYEIKQSITVFSINQEVLANFSDNPETMDVALISMQRQIYQLQPTGPYLLFCEHVNLYKLLTEILPESQDVFIAENKTTLGSLIEKVIEINLYDKIKKTAPFIEQFNCNPLPDFTFPEKTRWILGDMLSGKTTYLLSLYKHYDGSFAKNRRYSKSRIPIYFSLRGLDQHAITYWLNHIAKLNAEEVALLSAMHVIFLCDDYDLLSRHDFPKIINTNSNWKIIIACRKRHMLDPKSWRYFNEDERIYLPEYNLKPLALEDLIVHEEKRLEIENIQLPDLHAFWHQKISLMLLPSAWKNALGKQTFHNLEHFNFLRELLILLRSEDAVYQVPEISWPTKNLCLLSKATNIVDFPTPEEFIDQSFITIREGSSFKPIFCFAPITGDLPNYYTELSALFGTAQPVYVFKLSDNSKDHSDDLNARVAYYAKIIQLIYPHGDFILLGWSFGAMQAFACANALLGLFSRKTELIINIDCAFPKDITNFDFDTRYQKLISKLKEKYKSDETFEKIAANIKINLQAYVNYLKTNDFRTPVLPDTQLILFKAETTDTGLTEADEFVWPISQFTLCEIKSCDHFTIFNQKDFKKQINEIIHRHQPVLLNSTLPERIKAYCQQRLQNILLPDNYQALSVEISGNTLALNHMDNLMHIFNLPVSILIASPGAGKTTTLMSIESLVLKDVVSSNMPPTLVPFFISLNQDHLNSAKSIILQIGLTWQELVSKQYEECFKIVFLLDGLDEAKDFNAAIHLINQLKSYGSICISTREYFYRQIGNLISYIGPHEKINLLPLTIEQIKSLLTNEEDFDFINQTHALKEFISNPLMLYLMMQVINELKQINESYAINRYLIYKLFFEKLFTATKFELEGRSGIRPNIDILQAFTCYAKTMSYAELAGISYNLPTGIDTLQAGKACIVNQHQTFAEYFAAQAIVEDLDHYYHDSDKNFYNLSVSYLKENQSVLDFIFEILQSHNEETYLHFIHTLYLIVIDESSSEFSRNNAIAILLKLNFPLSGYHLSDLSLQVNFSGAVLHKTNLLNTKLSKSHLSRAFMAEANLFDADLRDCNFSLRPRARFEGKINAFCVFNQGQYYAVLCNNQINVFNFHDRSLVKTLPLELLGDDIKVTSMQIFLIKQNIDHFKVLLLSTRKTLYLNGAVIANDVQGFRLSDDKTSIYYHSNSNIYQYHLDFGLILTQAIDLYSIEKLENLYIDYESRRAFYSCDNIIFIKYLNNDATLFTYRVKEKIIYIAPHNNSHYIIVYTSEDYQNNLLVLNTKEKSIAYRLLLDNQPALFGNHVCDNVITFLEHQYNDYSIFDTGESIVENSYLCFYDISNAFAVSINHRFDLAEPTLLNPFPLLLHKISDRILGLFSLVQKKNIAQIVFDDEILHFEHHKHFIYALSNNHIDIYDLNQETFFPKILFPPNDEAFNLANDLLYAKINFYFSKDHAFLYGTDFIFDLNSKKWLITTERRSNIYDIYFDESTNKLFAVCERNGKYDDENSVGQVFLEIKSCDLTTNTFETILSNFSGWFSPEESPYKGKLLSIKEKLYIIYSGCLYDLNSVENKIEKLHTLSDKAGNFTYLSDYDILIFSSTDDIKFYDFANFKLIYQLVLENHSPYDYMHFIYKIEFNETLNLLHASNENGSSFWNLNLGYHQIQATLLYTQTVEAQLIDIKLNDKTMLDANNLFLFEKMNRLKETPLIEQETFGQTQYPIPYPNIHLYAHVLRYLSYQDRLMLSAVNKKYRILANTISPQLDILLTTDDVIYLTNSRIKPYLKQFFVNNFYELPKEDTIAIKPHPTKTNSLKVGFFSKGNSNSLDIDLDLLIQGRFKFTQ